MRFLHNLRGATAAQKGPSMPAMNDLLAAVHDALTTNLSAATGDFELRPSDGAWLTQDEDGAVRARLQLIVYEGEGDTRQVRDIKEQELFLLDASQRERPERALAFVRAWSRSVAAIAAGRGAAPETLLPVDLLVPEALADASLETEPEFFDALHDVARVAAWIERSELAEWEDALSRWDLSDRARDVHALLRPAISFEDHERVDEPLDDPTPVGATRFGGEPDLPSEVAWPSVEGRPMTFAAQLDLASLASFRAASELPRDGVLSFFYDAFPGGGVDEVIRHEVRVMHTPASAALARRATPAGGDRRPEFRAEPREMPATMPPMDSPFYESLLPDATVVEFRSSLADAARGEGSLSDPLSGLEQFLWTWHCDEPREAHRALGYCQVHQGDPYLEVELYTAGRGFRGWDDCAPEAIATRRHARRWRLLLQVCALLDGELLLEQDAGYFYFFLPDDALAARDWSRASGVLQCS